MRETICVDRITQMIDLEIFETIEDLPMIEGKHQLLLFFDHFFK